MKLNNWNLYAAVGQSPPACITIIAARVITEANKAIATGTATAAA